MVYVDISVLILPESMSQYVTGSEKTTLIARVVLL